MKLIRLNNEPTFSDLMNSFFENDSLNFFNRQHCSVPAANIVENENSYELELAVPGMNKEDFRIDVENNMLTISSEKKEENEESNKNYTRKEFVFGSFSRSFMLPKSIDNEKINAEYKNGVLCLHLPKREEEKTKIKRQIAIS
ncbi:MAG TPA: Hsp20/alpha crystallin family protein [Bacteroidales bacterium]|nr:Hsp20/alpha crystallin family protein [Bacteroidales bacterium]HNX06092.1 Hsp20/alpha crystallin family protein [Bacteroidales bacterium]HPS26057.1 Hsp20/alpha crystallin family protein [Bacteroidales bacterium]